GSCYIYPPFLARALALGRIAVGAVVPHSDAELEGDRAWALTFYFFQCLQLIALGSIYVLLYRIARVHDMAPHAAALLVSALLIVNVPLFHTLTGKQINLFVLALALLAIVAIDDV